jgi:pyruvate/2-oxoglutarate/acetoin dehydrogenase E1 component
MEGYFEAIRDAMTDLAKDPRTIFVGQAVAYPGTAMSRTLEFVPESQKLEFPVAENFQMGFCIGLALQGYLPVCIYPRFNFLLCAIDQLVLHLDKFPAMGAGVPKVIIRTAVAHDQPMNPGPQHLGDFTEAVSEMLTTVHVRRVRSPNGAIRIYKEAVQETERSTLAVEMLSHY